MGPGDMGPGDMGPGDMGPGDMGPGDMGPGDMGPGDMGQSERKESGCSSGRLMSLTALLPTVPEIRYLLARVLLRPPIRTRFIMAWSPGDDSTKPRPPPLT